MQRIWAVLITLIAAVTGVNAGKAPQDTPLNLWFDNSPGRALTSDGQIAWNGVTADYINGLQNVLAVIQNAGNFRFTTQDNARVAATRCLWIDFGAQPLNDVNVQPRQCANVLEPMLGYPKGTATADIATLRLNDSTEKLVRFAWDVGGYSYRLGYGTDMDGNGVPDSPPVIVSCVAESNARCSRWDLRPADPLSYAAESSANNVDSWGAAAFYRFKILKSGDGPAELLGYYVMPFTQTFTRK